MSLQPTLSVIVPVYNEVDAVGPAVQAILGFLADHCSHYEIILVESGSSDGSGAACDQLAADNSAVRVIHEGARNGFGSALRVGFAAAEMDAIVMITADLPFPFSAVAHALSLLDEHGAVLSYRASDPRGLYRRVQSVIYNAIAKYALGLRVRHVNSALKIYRRGVYEQLQLRECGWLFDAEAIYRLQERAVPCAEIPADLIDRETGTSSVGWRTPFRMLGDLRRLRVRLRANPLPPLTTDATATAPAATRASMRPRELQ
ncbi:MAG: glycosyltransferase family 2 protein [Planctomycetota bacterium]